MTNLPGHSRRDFLAQCLTGAFAFGAGAMRVTAAQGQPSSAKSRVVVARDPALRGSGTAVDAQRLTVLLDRAMQALFESDRATAPSPEGVRAAWRRIASPNDTVGLKVNTLGGRGISTNVELAAIVCERLQQAGVPARSIVVWDRSTDEMERAGFHIAIGGDRVQCYGTDRVDYEDDLSAWGSVGSRLSKILTRSSSVLINLPVLKDHDGAGVTIALKNMYGAIHNPNKYHPNAGDPYIADVNMLEPIRRKVRLHICEGINAQYEGGPSYMPQWQWAANLLLVARDPVALD